MTIKIIALAFNDSIEKTVVGQNGSHCGAVCGLFCSLCDDQQNNIWNEIQHQKQDLEQTEE